jgi:hypothetical protein
VTSDDWNTLSATLVVFGMPFLTGLAFYGLCYIAEACLTILDAIGGWLHRREQRRNRLRWSGGGRHGCGLRT